MDDGNTSIPPFATGFPAADEARWREMAERALKGAPFSRLISKTAEGIEIQPLYPRAQSPGPRAFARRSGGFDVMARVDHPDPAAANELARAEIEGGAGGLHLIFAGSAGAHGFGLPDEAGALRAALAGIDPAGLACEIDFSPAAMNAPQELADLIVESGLDPASARVAFGINPLAVELCGGGSIPQFATKIAGLSSRGFAGPFCVADGRIAHAAGGGEAQELAFVLSGALACLRALEAGGMTLENARAAIGFRLAADADQFLSTAKFRALSALWTRVEEACGLNPAPAHIHGETAWRMMTRRDPQGNLLRGTIAAFAAAIGGADRISVLPYSQAIGLPDAFARRLARNTQLVMLEEANIARVADPAAGSGGFEALTKTLCEKAWELFQAIEREGGVGTPAARNLLAGGIAETRARRARDIATRRQPITGVSEFPALGEAAPIVLRPAPADAVAGDFAPVRDAAPYEALRDRADAMAPAPRVFLANLGAITEFTARANFAKSLFEAGGIEALSNDGFADETALAAAFSASGASLACICSSDAIYEGRAEAAARALRAAGVRAIWLAGRPGANEAALRAAGVSGFAYLGCDALALLNSALAQA